MLSIFREHGPVQILTEQNAKQFEVIFGIRDRLSALEEQIQELQGSRRGFWGPRRPSLQRRDSTEVLPGTDAVTVDSDE